MKLNFLHHCSFFQKKSTFALLSKFQLLNIKPKKSMNYGKEKNDVMGGSSSSVT